MQPELAGYREQAACRSVVPVWEEWLADALTPIEAYCRLGGGAGSFLLESAEEGRFSRYSLLGREPWMWVKAREGRTEIITDSGEEAREERSSEVLKELLPRYRVPAPSDGTRFWGGGVGYFAYDWARELERLPETLPDDLGLPDCWLMFPRQLILFDHWRRSLRAVVFTRPEGQVEAAYRSAAAELGSLRRRLATPASLPPVGGVVTGAVRSNFTPERFAGAVTRAKEYIFAGDVFQVVLSQRWEMPFQGDPLAVYRALRYLNPSPYLFYLDFGPLQLVGSSPEMLVRVEGEKVETNPIAGTRPRGGTAEEDRALEAELLADPKERAEHVMLVDLGRNDLGRVCAPGTVEVEHFMEIERYSHVMHLVSRVQGEVASGLGPVDVLAACFPAGTVSGAPKVRAMEIIEELENVRRGPYAGAVGYVSLNGNLDTCLAIRTLIFCGGRAYIQAGAGIVARSRPEAEYRETVNKARVLFQALELAGRHETDLATVP
ncbi:MAG: anthranilate synthase component I [Clostridia bacterium]|nr:anthranilate synthase component I [Clostridia bacterium]MDH7572327.1 anthranilate synthase component I [Clostridia bacterium]